MTTTLVGDLLAYCTQLACLVAVAGALPAALRVQLPSFRYAYFRGVLLLCLVLPWLQHRPDATATTATEVLGASVGLAEASSPAGVLSMTISWPAAVAGIVVLGIVARLAWIGIGLFRLRRLRTIGLAEADLVNLTNAGQLVTPGDLQQVLGTHADVRYVANLAQPITFGLRRPVVLLPRTFIDHPAHVQRAVLSHELFHVRRRDWGWQLAEEVVRAVFWFHPGMWWLISRIQLSREEVVDQFALLTTGTRREYMEALMAFADHGAPVAPAAAFSRRRHLFRRITLISKETIMSVQRAVLSGAAMALVVCVGSWYSVSAFPLTAVTVAGQAQDVQLSTRQAGTEPRAITAQTMEWTPTDTSQTITVSGDVRVVVRGDGRDVVIVADVARIGGSVPRGVTGGVTGAVAGGVGGSVSGSITGAVPEPLVELGAAPRPSQQGPIRVGGVVRPPTKVKHVDPVYPQAARDAGVQGVVILELTVGTDGRVTSARILKSIELLDQAALDAVGQWEFTPTTLNGVPQTVLYNVTVTFTLS